MFFRCLARKCFNVALNVYLTIVDIGHTIIEDDLYTSTQVCAIEDQLQVLPIYVKNTSTSIIAWFRMMITHFNIHSRYLCVLRKTDYFSQTKVDYHKGGIVIIDMFCHGFRRIILPVREYQIYNNKSNIQFELYQHLLCIASSSTELTEYTKHVFISPELTFHELDLYFRAVMRKKGKQYAHDGVFEITDTNLDDKVANANDNIVTFLTLKDK